MSKTQRRKVLNGFQDNVLNANETSRIVELVTPKIKNFIQLTTNPLSVILSVNHTERKFLIQEKETEEINSIKTIVEDCDLFIQKLKSKKPSRKTFIAESELDISTVNYFDSGVRYVFMKKLKNECRIHQFKEITTAKWNNFIKNFEKMKFGLDNMSVLTASKNEIFKAFNDSKSVIYFHIFDDTIDLPKEFAKFKARVIFTGEDTEANYEKYKNWPSNECRRYRVWMNH